jgi:hypothetical protein
MTFLFSRGQISAAGLALSVIIVHSTRGTLSTILIGSAIFDVYKKRNEFLRMVLEIDERWQDVIIVSCALLVGAYLYGVSLRYSATPDATEPVVEEVFQKEIKLFHSNVTEFEGEIQKTMRTFENEIAKSAEH